MDTPVKKIRVEELDIVRAICILAVIMVHATSFATVQLADSKYFVIYNGLNIISKFGTPTFIAMSGFVLFYNYIDRPLDKQLITSFYNKRLLNIVLPYVIFSLLYFAISKHMAGAELTISTMVEFIHKLFTGKAYTHLYFVFIIAQFYLLFPVLLILFHAIPSAKRWAIPIGILIQWSFIMLNKYQFQVENRGSWCLTYFFYYMMGAWMGMYYPQIKAWFARTMSSEQKKLQGSRAVVHIGLWIIWLVSGLSLTYAWYFVRQNGIQLNSTVNDILFSLFSIVTLPVLMQVAGFLLRTLQLRMLTRQLHRIGELSFGIYLIHPLFLLVYREYRPGGHHVWALHLWYAGGFVIALVCSWIVVGFTARYLKHGWIMFGSLPTQRRERKITP